MTTGFNYVVAPNGPGPRMGPWLGPCGAWPGRRCTLTVVCYLDCTRGVVTCVLQWAEVCKLCTVQTLIILARLRWGPHTQPLPPAPFCTLRYCNDERTTTIIHHGAYIVYCSFRELHPNHSPIAHIMKNNPTQAQRMEHVYRRSVVAPRETTRTGKIGLTHGPCMRRWACRQPRSLKRIQASKVLKLRHA